MPVEVHAPELYLSIPHDASVEAGGEILRAKPPSNARSVPDGVSGELVYVGANLANLRSYAKNVRELFGASIGSFAEARGSSRARSSLTEGFGNPALTALAEEWGAIGLIAINPGVDIHWGTCTTIWGTPDLDDLPRKPKIPVVAVNKPDGEKLIALAERGGKRDDPDRARGRLVRQKIPVVHIPGATSRSASCWCTATTTAGTSASATTPPATPRCWSWPAFSGTPRPSCAAASASPGGRATRPGAMPAATWYADAFAMDLAATASPRSTATRPAAAGRPATTRPPA